MQPSNNLHSMDAVLDHLYGKEGTPEREAFRSEARNIVLDKQVTVCKPK